jgi:hypothetical protein
MKQNKRIEETYKIKGEISNKLLEKYFSNEISRYEEYNCDKYIVKCLANSLNKNKQTKN